MIKTVTNTAVSDSLIISARRSQGTDGRRGEGNHADAEVEAPPGQARRFQSRLRVRGRPQGRGGNPGELRVSRPEGPDAGYAVHHQHHR